MELVSDIVDFRHEWRFFLVSPAFFLHILTYSAFDSLCYILCYIQQAFTFWKSSCTRIRCKIGSVCKEEPEVVLEEGVKLVQKFAIKHQNVLTVIVLMFLLLTLNIFHILFLNFCNSFCTCICLPLFLALSKLKHNIFWQFMNKLVQLSH